MRIILIILVVFLTACESNMVKESRVSRSIYTGDLKRLKELNDIDFVRKPNGGTDYLVKNATELAVYVRNEEALEYLMSIDAILPVRASYFDHIPSAKRSVSYISPAELACGIGAFEIMDLLQKYDSSQSINYTNCLHYQLSSQILFPNPDETQTSINKNIEKAIALGGDISSTPDYGRGLHFYLFDKKPTEIYQADVYRDRLDLLLNNGLDPNITYKNLSGSESLLTRLSTLEDEEFAQEMIRFLVLKGADVNKAVDVSVSVRLSQTAWVDYDMELRRVTPLHIARFYSREQTANLLIELGADTEIKDDKGLLASAYK